MKNLKVILVVMVLFLSGTIRSQVSLSVNIGSPPSWGPYGYSNARYYYLPDIEAYYDVESAVFIYYGNGVWIRNAYLPSQYSNYDLYGGYKVVMTDYYGGTPYIHFKEHKAKYYKGYYGNPQKSIGLHPGKGNSGPNNIYKNSPNRKNEGNTKGSGGNDFKHGSPGGEKNHGNGGGNGNRK